MSPRGSLGFGSSAKLQVVPLGDRVLAEEIDRLAEALQALQRILGGVGLHALAPAPEDVDLRAKLDAEVDRAHRLLQRIGAHARVVGGERAILEGGIGEEVGRRHRHDEARLLERRLEVAQNLVALGGGRVDGNEVVVVQVDAIDATDLAEQLHQLDRRALLAHRLAERVAPDVADGPQAKGEVILRARLILVTGGGAHDATLSL